MTAYNAKHPNEPDWQIPRGVFVKTVGVAVSPILAGSPRRRLL